MVNNMRKMLALLFFVGLLLGPIYYGYCLYYSGELAGELLAYEQQADVLNLAKRQSAGTGAAKWNTPLNLSLTENMSPVSLIAEAHYIPPETSKYAIFEAWLSKNNEVIFDDDFRVTGKGQKVIDEKFIYLIFFQSR